MLQGSIAVQFPFGIMDMRAVNVLGTEAGILSPMQKI
jgi:hypothetical protein